MAGRPAAFDKQEKLQSAMMLFWQKGFADTSIQDLVDTLKINRFSIYNTYGDKHALFLASIENYRNTVFHRLISPLQTEKNGAERLDDYLQNFSNALLGSQHNLGCLLQNTGLEKHDEENRELTNLLQYAFNTTVELLRCALMDTGMDHDIADEKALHLFSTLQGLIAFNRMGIPSHTLQQQIDFLRSEVNAWTSPQSTTL